MSSILTDPFVSSELEVFEDAVNDEESALYVPAELRELVAEVAATLEEAQQSFLSSAHETTEDNEQEEDATATTTTTTAGEAST
jgi:hypothetical protein